MSVCFKCDRIFSVVFTLSYIDAYRYYNVMPNINANRKQYNNTKNIPKGVKNKTELVAYVKLCTK